MTRPWPALGYLLLLTILLRWGTSFISVINHDESTYIVIAREMLNGKVYLRDVIDTKPIGVFWLYAGLLKLSGGSIAGIRWLTHLSVGLTAWAGYWAGRRATNSGRVGLVAGAAYVLVTGVFSDYGIGPNSELFFNLLTVSAVALGVAPRVNAPDRDPPVWHWPVMGLLLGGAVIIKPFAAAESLTVGLFALWYYWGLRRRFFAGMMGAGTLVLGFCVPLLAVFVYYWRMGMVEPLVFYNIEVNAKYPADLAWHLRLKFLGDYLLRFLPIALLSGAALAAAYRKGVNRVWLYFLLGYFALVAIMIMTPGRRFGYYQVQLHPALCLLAAAFFDGRVGYWHRVRRWLTGRWAVYGLLGLAGILGATHYVRYQNKVDRPRLIADYLGDKLGPNEQFFSITSHQISYHLLDREVPTPFVHTALMFYDDYVRAYGIDERAEADRLIANEDLRYVIRHPGDTAFFTPLSERLLEQFVLVDSLDAQLYVYERGERRRSDR